MSIAEAPQSALNGMVEALQMDVTL